MARKTAKTITYHKRIVAALEDGQWHTLRDLYNRVARFIDPGVADTEFRRRHPDWKDVKEVDRVAQGRKRLVFLSLNSAHHHAKTVEVRGGKDWEREYRLTPETQRARQKKGDESKAAPKPAKKRQPNQRNAPKPSPTEKGGESKTARKPASKRQPKPNNAPKPSTGEQNGRAEE